MDKHEDEIPLIITYQAFKVDEVRREDMDWQRGNKARNNMGEKSDRKENPES